MLKIYKSKKLRVLCIVLMVVVVFVFGVGLFFFKVIAPAVCGHSYVDRFSSDGTNLLHKKHVAHVRLESVRHNISADKRTEYRFEVIEWLNGGNGEKNIKVYSQSIEKGCLKSNAELYAEKYEAHYEVGKTYIISLGTKGLDYSLGLNTYVPLYALNKARGLSRVSFRNGTIKAEELTPADLLFYLREYYENKNNEKNQAELENPSDENG